MAPHFRNLQLRALALLCLWHATSCRPYAGAVQGFDAAEQDLESMAQQPMTPAPGDANGGLANPNDGASAPTKSGVFFSPYKYVGEGADWTTGMLGTAVSGSVQPLLTAMPTLPAVTFAFATGECNNESWSGLTRAQMAAAVPTFVAAKVPYVLSTGGAGGVFTCGSDANFIAFLDRFDSPLLAGVDFDIEAGQPAAQIQALCDRVKMAQSLERYKSLRYSFTLPTLAAADGTSLSGIGETTLAAIQKAKIENYFINLMVMDYGAPQSSLCVVVNGACQMGQSAILAANNLHTKYNIPYSQIELTPLIGGNDVVGEVFTIEDVQTMMAFVNDKGIAGVHYWALDRDVDCSTTVASNNCNNYGKAGRLGFFNAFMAARH